jgi:hypothetical protein
MKSTAEIGFSINITAEIDFALGDVDENQRQFEFPNEFLCNQRIKDLLIYIVSHTNKFIEIYYSGQFISPVTHYSYDYNNSKLTITFTSLIVTQINLIYTFAGNAFNFFFGFSFEV